MKKRKLILGVGALSALVAPIAAVIACNNGDNDDTLPISQAYKNLVTMRDWKLSNVAGTDQQVEFGNKMADLLKGYGAEVGTDIDKDSVDADKAPAAGGKAKVYFHNFKLSDIGEGNVPMELLDGRQQDGNKARNIILDIPARTTDVPDAYKSLANTVVMVGAHYDIQHSHAGQSGESYYSAANDNRSGDATVLALAQYFIAHPQPYAIRIAFWDWEEQGTIGSNAYVKQIMGKDFDDASDVTADKTSLYSGPVKAYINLDSPAGGDDTNMGHGFDDGLPGGQTTGRAADESLFRTMWDTNLMYDLGLEPEYPEGHVVKGGDTYDMGHLYPEVSDEAAFSKVGVPFVGFESNNYSLVAKSGTKDGYAQTSDPLFWFPKTEADYDGYSLYKIIKNESLIVPDELKSVYDAAVSKYEASQQNRPERHVLSHELEGILDKLFKFVNSKKPLIPTEAQKSIGIIGGVFNTPGVNVGGYPRYMEQGNGYLWHTKMDTITNLNKAFPGRLNKQLTNIYTIVEKTMTRVEFFKNILDFN